MHVHVCSTMSYCLHPKPLTSQHHAPVPSWKDTSPSASQGLCTTLHSRCSALPCSHQTKHQVLFLLSLLCRLSLMSCVVCVVLAAQHYIGRWLLFKYSRRCGHKLIRSGRLGDVDKANACMSPRCCRSYCMACMPAARPAYLQIADSMRSCAQNTCAGMQRIIINS